MDVAVSSSDSKLEKQVAKKPELQLSMRQTNEKRMKEIAFFCAHVGSSHRIHATCSPPTRSTKRRATDLPVQVFKDKKNANQLARAPYPAPISATPSFCKPSMKTAQGFGTLKINTHFGPASWLGGVRPCHRHPSPSGGVVCWRLCMVRPPRQSPGISTMVV